MRLVLPFVLPVLLFAQAPPANKAIVVEHAVPFGTVTGKLLLLGSSLVFYDDQQPESSFVVSRAAIESLTAEGATITVQTSEAVRSRSGEVRRLSFRVPPGGDPAPVTGWYAISPAAAKPPPAAATAVPASKTPELNTYQVIHDKRIGSTNGRLLVSEEMLSYESISDVKASRRWEYKAIKEVKHPNPYELEIRPFEGDPYKFKLEGGGMDPAGFQQIVDRVTKSRRNLN
ncbi:MAG: hypothetical protein K2X03_20515 [Bryobacteraceae bacterium]|nr:hypothetical protein [Bryobacteraceae bacterium]